MSTLQHHVPAAPAVTRQEETQAHDNYVLATRVVHRAETLLNAATGFPVAVAHIEAAIAAALEISATSTWSEVRDARDHLDAAQDELERCGYRFC